MITAVAYIGTALPAANATVTIFSTVDTFPMAFGPAMTGSERLTLGLLADQAGTLTAYKSSDRGANWSQINTDSVPGSSTLEHVVDYLIEEYRDFKVDFTVGGSNETVFVPSISLTTKRARG